MKVGFVIACHNKVDDLSVHLELFDHCPFPHEVIVVSTLDPPERHLAQASKYHYVRIDGYGHYIGPLLSACAGVRKCSELGLDYAVYRNADDWLFNYDFEATNLATMADGDFLCGGYSWLSCGKFDDITLNQVYFDVAAFAPWVGAAEDYFRRSPRGGNFLCEHKMSRWVKRVLWTAGGKKFPAHRFYRLPGREREPGIGWELRDLQQTFKVPEAYWAGWDDNNRFFNRAWQLIGSHDVSSRLNYWRRCRREVPYGRQAERGENFQRFVEAAKGGGAWNLKVGPEPGREPQARVVSRRIFC